MVKAQPGYIHLPRIFAFYGKVSWPETPSWITSRVVCAAETAVCREVMVAFLEPLVYTKERQALEVTAQKGMRTWQVPWNLSKMTELTLASSSISPKCQAPYAPTTKTEHYHFLLLALLLINQHLTEVSKEENKLSWQYWIDVFSWFLIMTNNFLHSKKNANFIKMISDEAFRLTSSTLKYYTSDFIYQF